MGADRRVQAHYDELKPDLQILVGCVAESLLDAGDKAELIHLIAAFFFGAAVAAKQEADTGLPAEHPDAGVIRAVAARLSDEFAERAKRGAQ